MINNDLFTNLDRIHTTPLGVERIKRNLCLDTDDDVVEWCKLRINNSNAIKRKGKNWYVQCDDFTLTVNANSYTIITAHKYKKRSNLSNLIINPIVRLSDSEYKKVYDQIDFKDADEEFISAFRSKDEAINCVYDGDKLVGLVELVVKKNAYLYIYINPVFRNRGLGKCVLKLCEEQLSTKNVEKIFTRFRIDNTKSAKFACINGYNRKFTSIYMVYIEDKFYIPELPVKQYQDEYYESAHKMYAEAFHEMRISVGDFPDSVVEQPDDNMRKDWANTVYERFVYIQDDVIIGYAHIEDNCIGSISIRKEYQGQGIGRSFMKFICNKILDEGYKEVFLYCVLGNIKAKRLYDSLNFKEVYTVEFATKYMNYQE